MCMGNACLSRRFVVVLAIGIMMVGLSGVSASTTVRAEATASALVAPLAQSPLATPVQGRSQHLVPTPAPTATFAAYQVSPLRIDGAARSLLAASGSPLWVGAAALLLLSGSIVLVLTSRR